MTNLKHFKKILSLSLFFFEIEESVKEELSLPHTSTPRPHPVPPGSFHPAHFKEQRGQTHFSHGSIFVTPFFWKREGNSWDFQKSQTVITRNTGRKYVLERLKLQSSELNELAWFVFSGNIGALGKILLSSLFIHLSPPDHVFTYTHLQADITGAKEKHSYSSPFSTWEDKDVKRDTDTGGKAMKLPL